MNSNTYLPALFFFALSSSALHAKTENAQTEKAQIISAIADGNQAALVEIVQKIVDDEASSETPSATYDTLTLLKQITADIARNISHSRSMVTKPDCAVYLYNEIRGSEIKRKIQAENSKSMIEYYDLNMQLLKEAGYSIFLDDKEGELLLIKLAKDAEQMKQAYPKEYKVMGSYMESVLELWEKRKNVMPQKQDKPSPAHRAEQEAGAYNLYNLKFEELEKSMQSFLVNYIQLTLIAEIEVYKLENFDMETSTKLFAKDTSKILSEMDISELDESYQIFIKQFIIACKGIASYKGKGFLVLLAMRLSLLEESNPKAFYLIACKGSALMTVLYGLNLENYHSFLFNTAPEKKDRKGIIHLNQHLSKLIEKRAAISIGRLSYH